MRTLQGVGLLGVTRSVAASISVCWCATSGQSPASPAGTAAAAAAVAGDRAKNQFDLLLVPRPQHTSSSQGRPRGRKLLR